MEGWNDGMVERWGFEIAAAEVRRRKGVRWQSPLPHVGCYHLNLRWPVST